MPNLIMDIFNNYVETHGKIDGRQFESEYQLTNFHNDNIYFTNLCRKLKRIENLNLLISAQDSEDLAYVAEFIEQANIPHELHHDTEDFDDAIQSKMNCAAAGVEL